MCAVKNKFIKHDPKLYPKIQKQSTGLEYYYTFKKKTTQF